MKCKVFAGKWFEAMDAFNIWAEGKALTKEVIIHTHTAASPKGAYVNDDYLIIVVFHPEEPMWEKGWE